MNQTAFPHNGFPKVGIRSVIDGLGRIPFLVVDAILLAAKGQES